MREELRNGRMAASDVPSTAWSPAGDRLGTTSCEPLALAGSPSLPLPPAFLGELDARLAGTRLPAAGHPALRAAIADRVAQTTQVALDPRSEVLVTNGAMHALDCVFRALVPAAGVVGFICPTFFADRLLDDRSQLVRFDTRPEDGWHLTSAVLEQIRRSRLDVLFVVNPNNPTGVVYTRDELAALVEVTAKNRTLLVVDEAYEAFVYDGARHVSVLEIPEARDRVVTIQSFTKSFGLVAARVGCVFGPSALLHRVERVLSWVTLASNPLSQALAIAALGSADTWRARLIDQFIANRQVLIDAIGRGSLPPATPIPEGATFAALDISGLEAGSEEAARRLWRETGIACVPGVEFPGDSNVTNGFVRLPLGAPEDVFGEAMRRLEGFFR
jgi:aspartate/methionine/tyrosine aminotransferase